MLKWQKFEIEKIRKSDDLCLFKIINLKNQVFTANQSDINIYLIQKKILSILTTIKINTKSKSKLKLNFKSINSDNKNDNNKIKTNLFMMNNELDWWNYLPSEFYMWDDD